ncbi:Hypothetical predicted protein [Lecanosticta acicola]|uniref:Uncharacterized protein n=1 Tax=Lecanosticta acicola TaxID=111012 RepID=A0AAI8YSD7_9PEZI|nr:Hypothetical predicted protein [Lecanosticta acicola]
MAAEQEQKEQSFNANSELEKQDAQPPPYALPTRDYQQAIPTIANERDGDFSEEAGWKQLLVHVLIFLPAAPGFYFIILHLFFCVELNQDQKVFLQWSWSWFG